MDYLTDTSNSYDHFLRRLLLGLTFMDEASPGLPKYIGRIEQAKTLSLMMKDNDNDKECRRVLLCHFLAHLCGPRIQATKALDVVRLLLDGQYNKQVASEQTFEEFWDSLSKSKSSSLDREDVRTVWNLYYAANHVISYPDDYSDKGEDREKGEVELTVDLVQSVHARIVDSIDGLLFREKYTPERPSCPSKQIKARLAHLLEFTQQQLKAAKEIPDFKCRLMAALKVATIFFSEFLHIRPFDDANGRTGYLLVNALLVPFVAVPFVGTVFDDDDDRDKEMNTVVLSEHKKHEAATTVVTYLLLCLHKTSTDYLYLMLD
jgi:hypothetical protein